VSRPTTLTATISRSALHPPWRVCSPPASDPGRKRTAGRRAVGRLLDGLGRTRVARSPDSVAVPAPLQRQAARSAKAAKAFSSHGPRFDLVAGRGRSGPRRRGDCPLTSTRADRAARQRPSRPPKPAPTGSFQ
jgi:hypothetical protein